MRRSSTSLTSGVRRLYTLTVLVRSRGMGGPGGVYDRYEDGTVLIYSLCLL